MPRSLGGRAVALDVLGGEVLARRRLRGRRGAGGGGSRSASELRFKQDSRRAIRSRIARASSISATRRSSGVVTLMFSSLARTTITRPPARSISQASSVAAASTSSATVERPLERARGGTPAASAPPTARCDRASAMTTPGASARLIVSVTGSAAIAASASRLARRAPRSRARRARRSAAGARRRARAPRSPGSPHRRAGERHGARTPSARRHRCDARPRPCALAAARSAPGGSATTIRSIAGDGAQGVDAPLQRAGAPPARRAPSGASAPSRSPLPAATIRATVIAGSFRARGQIAGGAAACAKASLLGRTAIWLVAESASSSSR